MTYIVVLTSDVQSFHPLPSQTSLVYRKAEGKKKKQGMKMESVWPNPAPPYFPCPHNAHGSSRSRLIGNKEHVKKHTLANSRPHPPTLEWWCHALGGLTDDAVLSSFTPSYILVPFHHLLVCTSEGWGGCQTPFIAGRTNSVVWHCLSRSLASGSPPPQEGAHICKWPPTYGRTQDRGCRSGDWFVCFSTLRAVSKACVAESKAAARLA